MESRTEMSKRDYLARIGLTGAELEPDVESLRLLQRSHLLTVPFENLDIHWRLPIVLDTEKFYVKVVGKKRGGFCYELNGLFNKLLLDLGFRTRIISARVFNGSEHGLEFDHAAMIVTIGADEYLADVGFGAFTAEPLRFVFDEKQNDANGDFVVRRFDHEYIEVAKRDGDDWRSEYIFKDVTRELHEFADMCDFQQHSPDSHFRKGKLCSIMTETGRKTLTEKSFIVTENGEKKETPVTSDNEFYNLLMSEFAIASAQV